MTTIHRIEKQNDGTYILTTASGKTYVCERWEEVKNGGTFRKWHVKIPYGPAREECGRTYISESHFEKSSIYEFETKTEHRTGTGWGGSWKDKMTDDERKEYDACAKRMAEIESLAKARPAREKTEIEKLEARIAREQALLAKLRGEA